MKVVNCELQRNLIWDKSVAKIFLGSAIIATLVGCAGSENEPLEGERLDFTTSNLVVTDEFTDSGNVSIGSASTVTEWRQGAGGTANNPGNVKIGSTNLSWSKEIDIESGGRFFGIGAMRISARPIIYDGKVFVYEQSARVSAFSLKSGTLVWSESLQPELEDGSGAGGGIVADGNRLFVATGYGDFAAFDVGTGEVLWKIELSVPARNAPAAAGGKVFVVLQNNEVFAVDQSSGTELWTFAGVPEVAGLLADANPAIKGDVVVVPFTSGEVMAIDTNSGEANWVDAVSKPFKTLAVSGISDVTASPVISGDSVVATSVAGQTISVNLETGERDWERNIGSMHTPIVSGNAVFIIDLDDRLIALNRLTGNTFWVTQLPVDKTASDRATWTGPLLGNGELLTFSSEGQYAKVNPGDGEIVSQEQLNEGTFVAPVTANGYLVVLDTEGISVFQ